MTTGHMTTAVTVHDAQQGAVMNAPVRGGLIRPVAPMADIIEAHRALDELIAQNLEEGPNKDYGPAPGARAGDKKRILYKSGAEKVNKWHGVYPHYDIIEKEVDHDIIVPWRKTKRVYNNAHSGDRSFVEKETEGTSLGLYRYVIRCSLIYRATGEIIGDGIGACSTLESKYIDRPRDLENTVCKMGQKRALLAATLNAYALSDRFTQDLEDMPSDDDDERVETQRTRPASQNEKARVVKETPLPKTDGGGIAVIPFGAEGIKGRLINDTEHVSLELLFSVIDWIMKPKQDDLRARSPELVEQIPREIARRVRERLATDDELNKMLPWVLKKDERKAMFPAFISACEDRMEEDRQRALDAQKAEASAELASRPTSEASGDTSASDADSPPATVGAE